MKQSTKYDEFKNTLLGRIKLNLAKKITNKNNVLPTKKQSLKYWEKEVKGKSVFWHYLIESIITDNNTYPIAYSEAIDLKKELKPTYDSLLSSFTEDITNFSIFDCPSPLPEELIAWIIKGSKDENTKDFGIIIGDENTPDKIIVFLVVTLNINNAIEIQQISTEKSIFNQFDDNIKQVIVELALKCFVGCDLLTPFKFIQLNKIKGTEDKFDDEKFSPPTDTKLMQYIFEVKNNSRKCVLAKVKVDYLELKDLDFAYSIPDQLVLNHLKYLDKIDEFGILTYEVDNKLVVSDDYVNYLILMVEERAIVTVVNLGEFIEVKPEVILKRGKIELMPPILVQGNEINLSKSFKTERINEKIKIIQKLRLIKKSLQDNFENIKHAIQENKLEEAFINLRDICLDPILHNEIIAVKGRFTKVKKDIRFGVIEKQNELIELNKIRQALLEILNEI